MKRPAFRRASGSAFFNLHQLIHPPRMAAPFKFRGKEGVYHPLGGHSADDAGAHGQHIGVVVPAGQLSGQNVAAQGAAHALHLVGGDRDANTGGADDDPLFSPAAGHSLGRGPAEYGVVAAVCTVCPKILTGDSLGGQIGLDMLL